MRHLTRSVPPYLLLGLLLAGCTASARATPHAAVRATASPVRPADATRAAALERAACQAWSRIPEAHDVGTVHDLRATALARATQAADLDPRWRPLAQDLTTLGTVELAYAEATVSEAYSLRPRMDALQSAVGKDC
ncbi:MAG: hypothetical protein ACXVFV_01205 [Mycobacteriales bacterium]